MLTKLLQLSLEIGDAIILLLNVVHLVLIHASHPLVFVIEAFELAVGDVQDALELAELDTMLVFECGDAATVSFVGVGKALLVDLRSVS